MKSAFESVTLGNGLQLKNRIIRSATFETGYAEKGIVNFSVIELYRKLAESGVGLIITGMMAVGVNSCINDSMVKTYSDSFVPRFREVTDAVHKAGAKIVVQLGHSGVKAQILDEGENPYAPSDIHLKATLPAKSMTLDQIQRTVAEYGEAALQCKLAGADGVQIHGAHGYLLNEFLSPYFNHREDMYGGPIENRARFLLEVLQSIRGKVGPDYPVLLKINFDDLVEPASTASDILWMCKEMEKIGIDAIEVSGGLNVSKASLSVQPRDKGEGFFADGALWLAQHLNVPVISVGGYRTLDYIEKILNQGNIAAISLCRPLISEPDLPKHWEAGEHKRSRCISCNKCFASTKLACILETAAG